MSGTANDPHYTFTYTNAHQLQSDANTLPAYIWQPPTNASTSYTPNALNQYANVGGVTYGYDAKGNLTSDGTWTNGYDAENRLLTASKTGVSASYAYDPLGRRTKKSGTGVTQTFYVDSGTDEIAEYDRTGTLVRRFVPGPSIDDAIAIVTTSLVRSYFHTNKQGSVIAMSGNSAALTEGPYTYAPYGNCFSGASACSSTGEPYRFTGRRFDAETGLYYYRARYYSSVLGRFLQTDPVGYTADLNLYTYVGNDPTDAADPSGECTGSRITQNGDQSAACADGGLTTQSVVDPRHASKVQGTAAVVAAATPPIGPGHNLPPADEAPAVEAPEMIELLPLVLLGTALNTIFITPAGSTTDTITGHYMSLIQQGSGNFSLPGSVPASMANDIGKQWVGPGARFSSDGKAQVSADGLRQYRGPSAKPNDPYTHTGVRANFESRLNPSGPWTSNAHLDVTP